MPKPKPHENSTEKLVPETLPEFAGALQVRLSSMFKESKPAAFWDFRWRDGMFSLLIAEVSGTASFSHTEVASRAAFAGFLAGADRSVRSETILRAVHGSLYRLFRGKAGIRAAVLCVDAETGAMEGCSGGFQGVLKTSHENADKGGKGSEIGSKEKMDVVEFKIEQVGRERVVLATDAIWKTLTSGQSTGAARLSEVVREHQRRSGDAAHRELTAWVEKHSAPRATGAGLLISIDWEKNTQPENAVEGTRELSPLNEHTEIRNVRPLPVPSSSMLLPVAVSDKLDAARDAFLTNDREIGISDDEAGD